MTSMFFCCAIIHEPLRPNEQKVVARTCRKDNFSIVYRRTPSASTQLYILLAAFVVVVGTAACAATDRTYSAIFLLVVWSRVSKKKQSKKTTMWVGKHANIRERRGRGHREQSPKI